MNDPRLAIFFADLHIGGSSGLMPPEFELFEGNVVQQNEYQEWLWKCWVDVQKWKKQVCKKDPYIAVLAGDLIDGFHHLTKELSLGIDSGDMCGAAIEVLVEAFKDAAAVYVTEGTHVHTGNHEHSIAKVLKWHGLNVVQQSAKKSAWGSLDLRIAKTLVNVEHHMSTTTRAYLESGAYSPTMADMCERRSRAGWEVPSVFIRAHRHQFGIFDKGYRSMIVLPPWQGDTRFTRRVVPGIVPQCGGVMLDWRNVKEGDLPTIHKRIHTADKFDI